MKQMIFKSCLAAMILAACNSGDTAKTEEVKPATDTTSSKTENPTSEPVLDSATMMKNWQAYTTLSELHKMMAKWNGTWSGEITMWMAPGALPSKSTGISVNKMALNGMYQVSTTKGTVNGMQVEGMNTLAYDNHKKVFETVWIDNLGSGIMHLQGPWDEATKTMTLSGKMVDPASGKEINVKETFKIIDDNTQLMEMFAAGPDGKEFKTMEIKYTRKK